jgi:hypothetical protein
MSGRSLKSRIVEQLEFLPDKELQILVNFVDFLLWRVTRNPATESSSESLSETNDDSQLDLVGDVLVLKVAKNPVDPQTLETAVQQSRADRIQHLSSW